MADASIVASSAQRKRRCVAHTSRTITALADRPRGRAFSAQATTLDARQLHPRRFRIAPWLHAILRRAALHTSRLVHSAQARCDRQPNAPETADAVLKIRAIAARWAHL